MCRQTRINRNYRLRASFSRPAETMVYEREDFGPRVLKRNATIYFFNVKNHNFFLISNLYILRTCALRKCSHRYDSFIFSLTYRLLLVTNHLTVNVQSNFYVFYLASMTNVPICLPFQVNHRTVCCAHVKRRT